jgi:hypothetical protein
MHTLSAVGAPKRARKRVGEVAWREHERVARREGACGARERPTARPHHVLRSVVHSNRDTAHVHTRTHTHTVNGQKHARPHTHAHTHTYIHAHTCAHTQIHTHEQHSQGAQGTGTRQGSRARMHAHPAHMHTCTHTGMATQPTTPITHGPAWGGGRRTEARGGRQHGNPCKGRRGGDRHHTHVGAARKRGGGRGGWAVKGSEGQ